MKKLLFLLFALVASPIQAQQMMLMGVGASSGAAYVTAYINTQGIAAFNNAGYNSIARQTISPQILSGGYYGYANGNTILPLTTGDQFYVAMYTAEAITVGTVGGVPCQLSLYQLP